MAKTKSPSILDALKEIKKKKFLPVYFFYGEDSYSIEETLKVIEENTVHLITSDFDKETFYGENKTASDVINFALAFPFASEKKVVIFKEFDKVQDKKILLSYIKSPADFTILIIIYSGSMSNPDSEPYKTLHEHGFLFEAKELKGDYLLEWLVQYAGKKGKILSEENARFLADIVGENRNLLESQLQKIFLFLGTKNEISFDIIKSLAASTKEYNIFDLQNAFGKKDKEQALKIAFNMLEKGHEPTYIIFMLTRYFTGLSRIPELTEKGIPEAAAARIVGTHPFYYKGYQAAKRLYSDNDLYKAAKALLNAELTVKTTSLDNKSVISILIAEIFSSQL